MLTRRINGFVARMRSLAWLPAQCHVCHAWPTQPVCEACVNRFAQPHPRCRTCARVLPSNAQSCGACLKNPPALDQCLAAVTYGYPWSTLIADFKFRERPGLARSFGTLMRATPWVEPLIEDASMLLPLPLSRQRLQARGYNQALLLARALHAGKTRSDLLLRIKHTPAQHTLERALRLSVLHDAFALEPLLAHQVKGQRIVLVDDVMTTGASLDAAARVLRTAGAAAVSAVVFARTE